MQVSRKTHAEIRAVLGERIARARLKRDWSQGELALRVTGKTRAATVSDWESGKKSPDAVSLYLLAEVLEVTTDYLLGRDSGEVPEPAPFYGKTTPLTDAERLRYAQKLSAVVQELTGVPIDGEGPGRREARVAEVIPANRPPAGAVRKVERGRGA